jgi:DNA-binding XRE family transcriptional regulator
VPQAGEGQSPHFSISAFQHFSFSLRSPRMGKRVPKKEKEKFAKELKAWRARKKFSQSEAAAHLGIPIDTLQNWEIAGTMPQGYMPSQLCGWYLKRDESGRQVCRRA